MANPATSRSTLRLRVLRKIDPISEPKNSTATSDSDARTALIDSVLAPAAQTEDFVNDFILVKTQPAKVDSTANMNDAGGISSTDTTVIVTSGAVFLADDGIQIENEIMRVTLVSTNTLTIVRGIQGTTAAAHADALDVFIIGPAVGEIARVTDVDFAGTASKLVLAPLSCSLISGAEYERHRKVRPSIINDRLDTVLSRFKRNLLIPVSLVTDGHMQNTGVTAWTAASATLTKDTATIRHGTRSLKIVATAASGTAKSETVYLPPRTRVLVDVDAYITPDDSAKITLYDVTNSAVIDTATSAASGWVHFEFQATLPATCEAVALWLEAVTNTDVVFFGHAGLWPLDHTTLEIPNLLDYAHDVGELVYFPCGRPLGGTGDDNAFRVNEQPPLFYGHLIKEREDTGITRISVNTQSTEIPWIRGRSAFSAFAGATEAAKDADTTVAHPDVVVNFTAASILDDLSLDATAAEKPVLAQKLSDRATMLRFEVAGIIQSMTPPRKPIITSPWTRNG